MFICFHCIVFYSTLVIAVEVILIECLIYHVPLYFPKSSVRLQFQKEDKLLCEKWYCARFEYISPLIAAKKAYTIISF